jgi:hypothetical protein
VDAGGVRGVGGHRGRALRLRRALPADRPRRPGGRRPLPRWRCSRLEAVHPPTSPSSC